jgi:hypothetical protein
VGVCLADIAKGARFVILAVLVTSTAPPISTGELEGLLGVVIGGALLAGLVIILARHAVSSPKSEPASSVVRSWIAVSLVLGLLAFCAASFRIDDSTLRSTLFGGLITSVGAAIAFYFSSKSADQARTDILRSAGDVPGRHGPNRLFCCYATKRHGQRRIPRLRLRRRWHSGAILFARHGFTT